MNFRKHQNRRIRKIVELIRTLYPYLCYEGFYSSEEERQKKLLNIIKAEDDKLTSKELNQLCLLFHINCNEH